MQQENNNKKRRIVLLCCVVQSVTLNLFSTPYSKKKKKIQKLFCNVCWQDIMVIPHVWSFLFFFNCAISIFLRVILWLLLHSICHHPTLIGTIRCKAWLFVSTEKAQKNRTFSSQRFLLAKKADGIRRDTRTHTLQSRSQIFACEIVTVDGLLSSSTRNVSIFVYFLGQLTTYQLFCFSATPWREQMNSKDFCVCAIRIIEQNTVYTFFVRKVCRS